MQNVWYSWPAYQPAAQRHGGQCWRELIHEHSGLDAMATCIQLCDMHNVVGPTTRYGGPSLRVHVQRHMTYYERILYIWFHKYQNMRATQSRFPHWYNGDSIECIRVSIGTATLSPPTWLMTSQVTDIGCLTWLHDGVEHRIYSMTSQRSTNDTSRLHSGAWITVKFTPHYGASSCQRETKRHGHYCICHQYDDHIKIELIWLAVDTHYLLSPVPIHIIDRMHLEAKDQ
jgi:hypothetical protein